MEKYGAIITVDRGMDGTTVVWIDTRLEDMDKNENPKIRVYLNSGCLFENPPCPVENKLMKDN